MTKFSLCCYFCILVLLSSCESKIEDNKPNQNTQYDIETTTNVEIVYSDSAKVKAKIKAPLLLFKRKENLQEMPKGVLVYFYDNLQNVTTIVSAEYGSRNESTKQVELRKNVVIKNKKGESFLSDEFIWDEASRRFISQKPVTIVTEGTTIHGTNFWSNEDFSLYHIQQSKGNFSVKQ